MVPVAALRHHGVEDLGHESFGHPVLCPADRQRPAAQLLSRLLDRRRLRGRTHHRVGHELAQDRGGQPREPLDRAIQPQVAVSDRPQHELAGRTAGLPKPKDLPTDRGMQVGPGERSLLGERPLDRGQIGH